MFGRNVDFAAVLSITLVMLGLAWVQSWHWTEALDSIRVENAIQVDQCPTSQHVMTALGSILK